ncbi:MAG: methyltransferase domain-containing protein [Candidatus Babeliales bacterium]
MSITQKEKQTLAFYDKTPEKYMAGYEKAPSFWKQELDELSMMVPSGRVLDIGVGKGKEAEVFISAGYEYSGIEPATGLRLELEKRFPNQQFISSTIYDWNLAPHSFDAFWCSAMLLHIPKENIDFALQQIKKVMKPSAIGFISLAQGKDEYFDKDSGRYFYLYEDQIFADILHKNGFAIKKQGHRSMDTHRQWLRSWLTYFVEIV